MVKSSSRRLRMFYICYLYNILWLIKSLKCNKVLDQAIKCFEYFFNKIPNHICHKNSFPFPGQMFQVCNYWWSPSRHVIHSPNLTLTTWWGLWPVTWVCLIVPSCNSPGLCLLEQRWDSFHDSRFVIIESVSYLYVYGITNSM